MNREKTLRKTIRKYRVINFIRAMAVTAILSFMLVSLLLAIAEYY